MSRVGMVDLDTSHSVMFTQRWNHGDCPEEQWVAGATVVAVCPDNSAVSPERIPQHTEALRAHGVEIVEEPSDLVGRVDAVCIESNDGGMHLERARPWIEAGVPLFIAKPMASSLADARKIALLAAGKGVMVFSSSSLRYALEVVDIADNREQYGAVVGAEAFSPAPSHPRNPGLSTTASTALRRSTA